MGLDYGSHSTYKYGDAAYSIGITSALNKIMNWVPYGYISNIYREVKTNKPLAYKSLSYKTTFASSRALVDMINIFVVSDVEKLEDSNIVSNISVYKGNNLVSNSYTTSRWYEYTMDKTILCELHSIPVAYQLEDTILSLYLYLKESDTSNVIIYSSSYLYDNQLLTSLDYVQPFRYTPVIVDNFLLPTFFISDGLHIHTGKSTGEDYSWLGRYATYGANSIVSLPVGESLPSGERVSFTVKGKYTNSPDEVYTSDIDSDSCFIASSSSREITYQYSGGSGFADVTSYIKILPSYDYKNYDDIRLIASDKQYLDNSTINSIINVSKWGLPSIFGNPYKKDLYRNSYQSSQSITIVFKITGNGNFILSNQPYDNTAEKYVYGGLSKYTPFDIYDIGQRDNSTYEMGYFY